MNGIVRTWRQKQSLDRAQSHGQGSSLAPSIQICPAALPMSHFHSVDLFVSVLSFLPSLFFKFCFFPSAYSICHIEMCPDSLIQCQIHLVIKGKTFPIPILFFSHINNSDCIKSSPSQPRAQPSAYTFSVLTLVAA